MRLKKYIKLFGYACAGGAGLLMTACMTPYQAPNAGDTANLVFKPNVLQERQYGLIIYGSPGACTDPMGVFSGRGPNNVGHTTIQANTLSTLEFNGGQKASSCSVIVSFYPKAGHTYQLDGVVNEVGCTMSMSDITNPNYPQPESTLLLRPMIRGFCAPLSQARNIGGQINSRPTLNDFKDLLRTQ